jgi:predicted RNase H-like HicB family nuclease
VPGCIADGSTPEEALQNIMAVMHEWLETAKEEGREIPAPITFDLLERNAQAAQTVLQQQIENRVRDVVGQILQEMREQQAMPNISSWREGGLAGSRYKAETSR